MKINPEPTVGQNMKNFRQWFVEKSETQEILSYGKQIIFSMCIFLKGNIWILWESCRTLFWSIFKVHANTLQAWKKFLGRLQLIQLLVEKKSGLFKAYWVQDFHQKPQMFPIMPVPGFFLPKKSPRCILEIVRDMTSLHKIIVQ